MTDLMTLPAPDRRIDIAVHRLFRGDVLVLKSGPVADGLPVPRYSISADAVMDLIVTCLPGWSWQVSTCAEQDNAWLIPDDTHPEHGASHPLRWPHACDWLTDGPGLEASFTPSPRGAMALLAVFLEVSACIEKNCIPDPAVPAALTLFNDALQPEVQKPADALRATC